MLKIVIPLVAVAVFIIFMIVVFTLKRSEKYSLKRYFPFEAAAELPLGTKTWFLCLVGLFVALLAQSYLLAFWDITYVLGKITAVFYILASFLLFAVFVVSLYNYKWHLITTVLFFLFTACSSFLALLTSLLGGGFVTFNKIIGIIMASLGFVLLVILFVPKLKYWMYLEKSEENGKTIYVRPKISILSLYEWIFIFAHVANLLLLAVSGFLAL